MLKFLIDAKNDDGNDDNNRHGSTEELTNHRTTSAWSLATGHHARVRLAALVATEVLGRFKQPSTGSAARKLPGTVDRKFVTTRLLVVPQHCKAVAAYTARATALKKHWPAGRLPGLPHFALLTSTSRRRPNLRDARRRGCHVAPFRCLWRQQRALAAANDRLGDVRSRRR